MPTAYEPNHCPVCGSDAARTVATAVEMRTEAEALRRHHLRRLRPTTPRGTLYDRVVFSQGPPLGLAQCAECGALYRDPVETPEAIEETYAEEHVEPGTLESLRASQQRFYASRAHRLTRLAHRPGRGIEVGSYVGAFLAAARAEGWRFRGVDVNEATNSFAREHGEEVETGTLETLEDDAPVDAVAIWNCFEQLADPRAALAAAHDLLHDGGLLALRVPNGGFYAALRPRLAGRLAGPVRTILASNNLLGFPYRNGYAPEHLRAMLERAGFEVLEIVPDVLVPLANRWTRGWAVAEERIVKRLMRIGRMAAWIEVYARKRSGVGLPREWDPGPGPGTST